MQNTILGLELSVFIGLLRFICKTVYFKTRFLISTLYWMPFLREIRNMLLFAHNDNLISEEEFLLLHDLNKGRNLKLPYWSCEQFDLHLLTDDECTSEFRFYRRDVYLLAEVL